MSIGVYLARCAIQGKNLYAHRYDLPCQQCRENSLRNAVLDSSVKLLIDHRPTAILLGQSSLLTTVFCYMQYRVNKIAILSLYISALNRKVTVIRSYGAFVIFMLLFTSFTYLCQRALIAVPSSGRRLGSRRIYPLRSWHCSEATINGDAAHCIYVLFTFH